MVCSANGSNSARGSLITTAACGHLLAGEGGQVGLLLRVGAPLGQGDGDAARREDRQRQAHVAVRERLGDKGVGDRAALAGGAVEFLGDIDQGDAEFGGALEQIGGRRGGGVGVVGGGTQDLGRELAHRLDDHLLLVVRGEVEVVLVLGVGLSGRRFGAAAAGRPSANARVAAPSVLKPVLVPS